MEPVGYAELLEQVKVRVRTSRVQAARALNVELVGLYWQIGRLILGRQESEGVGDQGHRPARGGSACGVPGDAGAFPAQPGLHADLCRGVR